LKLSLFTDRFSTKRESERTNLQKVSIVNSINYSEQPSFFSLSIRVIQTSVHFQQCVTVAKSGTALVSPPLKVELLVALVQPQSANAKLVANAVRANASATLDVNAFARSATARGRVL
jgi:hypothetical protein